MTNPQMEILRARMAARGLAIGTAAELRKPDPKPSLALEQFVSELPPLSVEQEKDLTDTRDRLRELLNVEPTETVETSARMQPVEDETDKPKVGRPRKSQGSKAALEANFRQDAERWADKLPLYAEVKPLIDPYAQRLDGPAQTAAEAIGDINVLLQLIRTIADTVENPAARYKVQTHLARQLTGGLFGETATGSVAESRTNTLRWYDATCPKLTRKEMAAELGINVRNLSAQL